MKKFGKILTAIVVILCATVVNAQTFTANGLRYNVLSGSQKTVEVAQYDTDKYTGVHNIPEQITYEGQTYTVTGIGDFAFYLCFGVTEVTLPNTIKSIGKYAFSNCTSLSNLVLPQGLTQIKEAAFEECDKFTEITIPNAVTVFEKYAFWGCNNLESVTLPNSITTIGGRTFADCPNLTSITLPETITTIGGQAFENCTSLTSIKIPNSVTSIGSYAFQRCSALKSITFGNGLSSIEISTFQYCTSLTSLTIPDNITTIGEDAFYNCDALTDVTIGNSVETIGNDAFNDCDALTDVTLGNSVKSIGSNAFSSCENLRTITLPSSIESIGASAFSYNASGFYIKSLIPASKLKAVNTNAFNSSINIYVPSSSLTAYKNTQGWNKALLYGYYDLTVSLVGYATLYLDINVSIPTGVEAYTATRIEGDYLKMEKLNNYIPANTAVIIKADAGTYTMNEAYSAASAGSNLLKGTLTDTYIDVTSGTTCYVLSVVDGVVGMYRAKLNSDGKFLNNANKAYMPITKLSIGDDNLDTSNPGSQLSNGYRFDFSGTTGIENIASEDSNVYYDLSGRCVENPEKGIYILNGKKVLIK